MIEILSIITFISILLINIGTIRGNFVYMEIGTIVLGGVVIFGWLILGILITESNDTETKFSKYNIEKTKYEVVLVDSSRRKFIFDKKIDYDNITDTTIFYLNIKKNIYGFNKSYYIFYDMKGVRKKSIKI